MSILSLEVTALARRLAAGETLVLLDVREASELAICSLPKVTHIPLGELHARAGELDPAAATVCICHHGIRSARAAGYLASLGFERVFNLSGGLDRWALEVQSSMRRYRGGAPWLGFERCSGPAAAPGAQAGARSAASRQPSYDATDDIGPAPRQAVGLAPAGRFAPGWRWAADPRSKVQAGK